MKKIWNSCFGRLANQSGMILFMVLALVVVFLLIGAGLLLLASNSSLMAERQRRTAYALTIAEAGLESALYDLRQDFVGKTDPSWADNLINTTVVDKDAADGDGYYFLYTSQSLNNGTYSVKLKNLTGSTESAWIRATGTYMNVSRTIQVYASIRNISVWNNVIFAGRNQTGNLINGNVNINGSVHILGTGLEPTDYAAELGGDAELVGNNYDGMDALLETRIPVLPTTVVKYQDGSTETVETLNGELRVKHGIVGLNGSATVGRNPESVKGQGIKGNVDGVFVNDGFGGNQGTANVYSDNGWSNPYDLGDSVTFPVLTETYINNFQDNALVISKADKWTIDDNSSSDFTYGDCATGACFSKTGAEMKIKGRVYVNFTGEVKDMEIGGNKTITYEGKGSILTKGNVTIESNLITPAPTTQPTYPQNIIGVMTTGNITIGVNSQRKVMGIFYAAGTIALDKQTQVTGTLVTNHFDLGAEVPKIYQVPETVNHLPEGMIESESAWVIKVLAWRLL